MLNLSSTPTVNVITTVLDEFTSLVGIRLAAQMTGMSIEADFDKLSIAEAIAVFDLLQDDRAAAGPDRAWGTMARFVAHSAGVIVELYQHTAAGVEAAKYGANPASIHLVRHLCTDDALFFGIGTRHCIDAIDQGLMNPALAAASHCDGRYAMARSILRGECWLGSPAPETRMGIREALREYFAPLDA